MQLNIIIRKFKSLFVVIKKNGIDGFYYALCRNLGFKIKYNSFIDKKKDLIKDKIIAITNKKIISGFYKSTYLSCNTHWGAGFDSSAKLLGLYEQQVRKKLLLCKKNTHLKI